MKFYNYIMSTGITSTVVAGDVLLYLCRRAHTVGRPELCIAVVVAASDL